MNTVHPLYRQEKRNTCALACLRMVLAAYGTVVAESVLEGQVHLDPDGTEIGELERVARRFGPIAHIQEATVDQLRQLLAQGKLPIAFIDRAVFDLKPAERAKHRLHDAKIHTVIPTRVTAGIVTFHDPLPPAITRRTMRLFCRAYDGLGGRSVVCSKP